MNSFAGWGQLGQGNWSVVDGTLSTGAANAKLQPLMPAQGCNGYWHGKPGLETWKADAQGALQQVMETA